MGTYLADCIRAVAADPTPDTLKTLPALAVQVERMERCLDEQVRNARVDAAAVPIVKKRDRIKQQPKWVP